MATFTRELIDEIIANPRKTIAEPIEWKKDKNRKGRLKFEVKVQVPDAQVNGYFRLVGTATLYSYSFVLLHQSNVRLRKISSPNNFHPDPVSGELMDPHHKHKWYDDDIGDSHVYIPDDIDWTSSHSVLTTFLAECNIIPLFDIPEPMFQSAMKG